MAAFLQALPAAATSPYAFVAYTLALIAWGLSLWMQYRPQRETQKILSKFKDDGARIVALTSLLGQAPPKGLARADTLEWVRIQSREKTKVYLLIAYLALIFAVIVVVVVAMSRSGTQVGQVDGPVIRFAAMDGADCLPLPAGVRVTVNAIGAAPQAAPVTGCEAHVPWAIDWQVGRSAQLDVTGASGFERIDDTKTYRLGDAEWLVTMRPVATAPRLVVQLFDYATSDASLDQQLDQFHTIVRNKIQMLAQSIATRDPECVYVGNLRVEQTRRQLTSSPSATLAEWRNSGALLFLSGLFFRSGTDPVVRSQPFFGELAGQSDVSRVQLDLVINPDEFARTTDSHSLAVVYALAMDAKRRGQPNVVVLTFLGEAVSIAQDLDSNVPGVVLLKNAVRDALRGIGAPIPEAL
jgi:hypothetical protein